MIFVMLSSTKARQYDIGLAPDQVTVQRTGSSVTGTIPIGADYTVPIHLPGFSLTVHFTPASGMRSYDYSHPAPLAVFHIVAPLCAASYWKQLENLPANQLKKSPLNDAPKEFTAPYWPALSKYTAPKRSPS